MRQPLKYERELFKLSDGGTIALDWHKDENNGSTGRPSLNSSEKRQRPILACVSGLNGGNDNLYLYSVIKAAS